MSLYYKPFDQCGPLTKLKGATFDPMNCCFLDENSTFHNKIMILLFLDYYLVFETSEWMCIANLKNKFDMLIPSMQINSTHQARVEIRQPNLAHDEMRREQK